MKRIIATFVCIGLVACSTPQTGVSPFASQADINRNGVDRLAANSVQDASFGRILNDLRRASGAHAVTFNPRLDAAAQAHANDMVARDYFSHTNPEGATELDRILATGFVPRNWGENIAQAQPTEADVLVAWINSPEHNRLLRARTVDEFGLGVAGTGSKQRWVLVMARAR